VTRPLVADNGLKNPDLPRRIAPMHERRFHPSQAHKLDDPSRLQWLPPAEILAHLHLHPEMVVADIGAGTGYFTLPIARAVQHGGRVLAVDVAPEMLARIQAKVTEAGMRNVECVEGEASATGLATASCDLALMANVWHEFDDHAAVLAEARRILRAGGRLALLDWRPDAEPDYGPPLAHRISAAAAQQSLAQAGFSTEPASLAGKYAWLVTGAKI
jgi:ubiquinone/menaquinone biosynthesis C-methylase UbiE